MPHNRRRHWRRWAWRGAALLVLGVGTTYATALVAHRVPYRFGDGDIYHFAQDGFWWEVTDRTLSWRHYIGWSCRERPVDANIEEARLFLEERDWISSGPQRLGNGSVTMHHIGVQPPTMGFREFLQPEILDGQASHYVEDGIPMIYLKGYGHELEAGWPMRGLKGASVGFVVGGPPAAVRGAVYFRGPSSRIFPLVPVFPAFEIDTLFYAIVWAGVIAAGRAARRGIMRWKRWKRRRRGLCPICRYDLVHDLAAGCPECGWGRAEQPGATQSPGV